MFFDYFPCFGVTKVDFCNHHAVCKKGKYPCNRPRRPIGLWDVEAPTFSLDNRLTDGGKVVSLTRWPPFTPQEDSWYSFLLEAEFWQYEKNVWRALTIIVQPTRNYRIDVFQLRWPRDTLYPLKLALTSPTIGGRSVGIVRACGLKPRSLFLLMSFNINSYWIESVPNNSPPPKYSIDATVNGILM
jgi:hypothetical protein